MATTWVFQRGDHRMYAQRQGRRHGVQLVVWGPGVDERVYAFDDDLSFVAFMTGFESDAVTAGWSLSDFIPERRHGGDRRSAPRGRDRRRPAPTSSGTLITFPKKD